jgi:hypothetical protein
MQMKIYQVNKIKMDFFSGKKMNLDPFWKSSSALTSFIFPWDDEAPPATIFRALQDRKYFYFRFDVIDTDIYVDKSSGNKMAVLDSDRVEIFFRSGEEMNPYYGLEMDPIGRVLDYKAEYYRKFDYKWTWPAATVRSSYTLNGYRVWGRIPLESLKSLNIFDGSKLEAGLFRGNWMSWVKPESETPDFHIPSAFGELRL